MASLFGGVGERALQQGVAARNVILKTIRDRLVRIERLEPDPPPFFEGQVVVVVER
jgi:hypothetical protein